MSGPYTSGAGALEVPPVSSGPEGSLPAGIATGDFLRFNATTGNWEVAEELIAMKGIELTPQVADPTLIEGTLYYNVDGTVKVATIA